MAQKKMLALIFIMSLLISAVNVSGAVIFEYILSDSIGMTGDVPGISGEESRHEGERVPERAAGGISDRFRLAFADINAVCAVIIAMYVLRWLMQVASITDTKYLNVCRRMIFCSARRRNEA